MKAGIINVTGYAGIELARILSSHPEVEIVSVTGRSSAGQLLSHVFPHLDTFDMKISEEIQKSTEISSKIMFLFILNCFKTFWVGN